MGATYRLLKSPLETNYDTDMLQSPPRIALPEPTSANFEYNHRTWPEYAKALESCGAVAVLIPPSGSQDVIARLASTCCGVLLPGSPADVNPQKYGQTASMDCSAPDPAREAVDELLLQDAFNLYKPVFGVCYGLQSLNVWRNGSLIQHLGGTDREPGLHDPGREVQKAHSVTIAPASRLEHLMAGAEDSASEGGGLKVSVNSSHHQAIDVAGDGLAVVARAVDDGVIEGLEGLNPEQYVLGVQWHPERTVATSAASRMLFAAFVQAARAWQPRQVHDSVAI